MRSYGNVRWRAALVLLLTLSLPAYIQVRAPGAVAAAPSASSCTLPVVHDRYDGFRIGVPVGWNLSTLGDTIAVARDQSGAEEAIVYPALQVGGLTPAGLFTAYSRILEHAAAAAGNALSFRLTSAPDQLPRAIVTGRAGTARVRGGAAISILPYRTAIAANQIVFSAYWAPTSRVGADGAALAGIAACYAPEAGTLYQVFQDQVFAFALPLGWQVNDEGQDNVDLVGEANRAVASYLLTLLPTSEAGTTAHSLLLALFAHLQISITHVLSVTDAPPQQTSSGGVQGQETMEFIGQFGGKPVHGLVYVVSVAGAGNTSGVMRLGMAAAGLWNSVNGGLIKVMTSIRHSMAQDQQQWQHLTQQWQQFNQTTQQFDDVLNGVQEVRDPTTGTLYAAPYDTYDPNGPNGPGYYIDDGGIEQRLQPVNS